MRLSPANLVSVVVAAANTFYASGDVLKNNLVIIKLDLFQGILLKFMLS